MPTDIWGNATWVFFHTLAQQVDENKTAIMIPLAIEIIKDTCNHLPCPYCSDDAVKIINKAYIKNIKKKSHLIEFVYQFHNIVNTKLKKRTYTKDEVNTLYDNENLTKLSKQVAILYSKKYGMMKLMSYNMHKELFLKRFVNNINKFQIIKMKPLK